MPMAENRKGALIAMSGGVDSSVAAWLMKSRGFYCIGATMKLYRNEEINVCNSRTCCSLNDVEDARAVAEQLDMPYYVFNYTEGFREEVMQRFVDSYERGQTPNPCIDCNRYMKFDRMLHRAKELGLDYIVTGHYAQIVRDEKSGRYLLKKAVDESKDQSYVLCHLTQEQLAHTLFPLGGMPKSEVREIAAAQGFVNADKSDSQDICFVPDGDYVKFMEQFTGKKYAAGDFLDTEGNRIGTHEGAVRYTLGQRKGLGISGAGRLYVCGKNMEENTVILGEEKDLYTDTLIAEDLNWIAVEEPEESMRVKAKVRYRQKEQWATVSRIDGEKDCVRVVFDEPQRAVTPGQSVVFYDGDTVVGGGVIRAQ